MDDMKARAWWREGVGGSCLDANVRRTVRKKSSYGGYV